LVTQLQSARALLALLVFVGGVSGMVAYSWPSAVAVRPREELGLSLFHTFFATQTALVVLITPALAGVSFTLEKERQTLELLQMTPLTPGQLLLSKFLAATGFMALLQICSLPVLALVLLLGGFSLNELIAHSIHLLSITALCGAMGITTSVFLQRSVSALGISYVLCIGAGIILESVRSSYDPRSALMAVSFVCGFYVLPPCAVLLAAARKRLKQPVEWAPRRLEEDLEDQKQAMLQLNRDAFPDRLILPKRRTGLLPDGVNPVFDKEFRSEIYGHGVRVVRTLILVSLLGAALFIPFTYWEGGRYFFYYLLGFVMVIGPAFSAPSLTQEWERDTMPMLMTTLLSPWQVLHAKLWMNLRVPAFLVGLMLTPAIPAVMMAFLGGGDRLGGGMGFAQLAYRLLVLAVAVVLSTLIGLCCSAVCRKTVVAVGTSYALVFVVFLGPLLLPLIYSVQMTSLVDVPTLRTFSLVSPFAAVEYADRCPMGAWMTWGTANPLSHIGIVTLLGLGFYLVAGRALARKWTFDAGGGPHSGNS
jgi:ABC-type transport system involved in multi-copper enzyme maturation permease subunit